MKARVCGTYHSECRKCGNESGNIVLESGSYFPMQYIECPSCGKRTVRASRFDMVRWAWDRGYIFSVDEEGCPVYESGKRINQGTWWC